MSGGLWKPVFDGDEIEAVNGWDIQTTIDVNIQDVAEDALLKSALEKYEAEIWLCSSNGGSYRRDKSFS